jgi:hypothetical protein
MTRIPLCVALLALLSMSAFQPSRAAVETVPGTLQIVPLDISTVTTGGVAVFALNPGNRSAGGWIQNPSTATVNLCIDEVGVASGTVSSGNVTCIPPGSTYTVAPSSRPVSVISSDSSHAFSGYGFKL